MAFVLLAVLAIRGARWAYAAFVGLALVYFPQKGGFTFQAPACSAALGGDLFVTSATNYSHIILFALFFLVTYAHFARSPVARWSPLTLAFAIGAAMGAVIEVLQGVSDTGNCELRDLVPDIGGILLGMIIVLLVEAGRQRWRAVVPVADRDD